MSLYAVINSVYSQRERFLRRCAGGTHLPELSTDGTKLALCARYWSCAAMHCAASRNATHIPGAEAAPCSRGLASALPHACSYAPCSLLPYTAHMRDGSKRACSRGLASALPHACSYAPCSLLPYTAHLRDGSKRACSRSLASALADACSWRSASSAMLSTEKSEWSRKATASLRCCVMVRPGVGWLNSATSMFRMRRPSR